MGKQVVIFCVLLVVFIGSVSYVSALQPIPKGTPSEETSPDSATVTQVKQGTVPQEILEQKRRFEKDRLNVLRKRKLVVPVVTKREYGIKILSEGVGGVEKKGVSRRDYLYLIISSIIVLIGLSAILIFIKRGKNVS